jgi:hypothetical protein
MSILNCTRLWWALTFTSAFSFGQTPVTIEYKSGDSVLVNGNLVSHTTTYAEIVRILGEPVIYKEYTTGKTVYHYVESGIILHTVNGKLLAIGVNYNWDGDKNFPETTFRGNLKIGTLDLNHLSKPEIVNEMKHLGIICVLPGMCMNNPKTVKNPILLGFKDNLITQVSIEFH